MRALAIALSLLVLGSSAVVAQQAVPSPAPQYLEHLEPGNVAAIGIGAVLGIVVAEAAAIDGAVIIGGIGGSIIGAWWYARGEDSPETRAAVRSTAARAGASPLQMIAILAR